MSSLDKAVIVDNEKVLTHPIVALPLSASIHTYGGKNAKTLIVTNGNSC